MTTLGCGLPSQKLLVEDIEIVFSLTLWNGLNMCWWTKCLSKSFYFYKPVNLLVRFCCVHLWFNFPNRQQSEQQGWLPISPTFFSLCLCPCKGPWCLDFQQLSLGFETSYSATNMWHKFTGDFCLKLLCMSLLMAFTKLFLSMRTKSIFWLRARKENKKRKHQINEK